jgi:hypothetical protein
LDWALRSAGVLALRFPFGLAVGSAFLSNAAPRLPRISARRALTSDLLTYPLKSLENPYF